MLTEVDGMSSKGRGRRCDIFPKASGRKELFP
jgi:hypothetical protein